MRELAVVFENLPTYRRYKPGTGPRLAPITLLPVHDTTAYIREEFFIPPALSVDRKKHLLYVVGWTDIPAARLQVDAERICDYVSPRAYEEWCAARAAERDEEERRTEEEENVRAVEEAEAREKRIFQRSAVKDSLPRGKKRNRPVADRSRTPPPKTNGEKKKPGRPRKKAPSLSTPSRSIGLQEVEASNDDTDVDMEEAIFRQLNGEEPISTEGSYDSGERSSVPSILEPSAKKRRTKSPRPTLSSLPSDIETDSSRSTHFESSRGGTSSPALPPLPKPYGASQAARPRVTPILPPVPPASILQTFTPTAPRTKTKTQPQKRSLLSTRDPPSTSSKQPSMAQTPTPKAQTIPPRAPATAPPAIKQPLEDSTTFHATTPGTGFTPLIQNTTPWTISLAASKNFANLTPSQPIRSIEQASSSTPKPTLPKPAMHDYTSPLKATQSAPPVTTAGSTQAVVKSLPAQEEQEAPEEDNIYEVLRLEGVQERIVRGKRVRFFHVRWKGVWPPGQNPTWEPEANIPRALIKKYFLAHPQSQPQGRKTGAMDKYLVSSLSHRKYSSVSEAFEGGDADGEAGGEGYADGSEEAVEDDGAEEEYIGNEVLLVTDEPTQPAKPTLSW
ncbi:chromo domain-containing protein [Colletotrichum graminicola M1.001]|uniref:Chromo domain-containing protein n=1 Tax=Colletotrichum graminicola (strain M1.001 / M2 / FGSC 10212) TaxID=645133 RepID=E3QZP9_COLGM|nr:chromo domain-containing protein [Colletotrichum graminicola M1.001]EFQ36337.1 chromo domain-containing protein [Colletotrichum graminicola M1.001]